MTAQYCPACRALKSVRVNVIRRAVTGPDGRLKTIRTQVFHCADCRQFIRSEDLPDPVEAP